MNGPTEFQRTVVEALGGVKLPERDCTHGQLARSCELCKLHATIEDLQRNLGVSQIELLAARTERDEALARIERAKELLIKIDSTDARDSRFLASALAILEGDRDA